MKKEILKNWQVIGTMPFQADFSKNMQIGDLDSNMTEWFEASVPGCVYNDAWKAGIIQDPYYERNSLNCEWIANRWWIYRTTFTLSEKDLDEKLRLCFNGIDYSAQIFLNGIKLGRHEGMYIPFEAVINPHAKEGENILVCIVEHAPFADPQPGYTSKTRFLKSRCNYKWDFACRLVSLGLYDKVEISSYPSAAIDYHFVRSVKTEGGWQVDALAELESFKPFTGKVEFKLLFNNEQVAYEFKELRVEEGIGKAELSVGIDNPKLWWPNGYGEQNLYDYEITLSDENGVTDIVRGRLGIRTLEYRHADGRKDALKYNVVINGKRIYLKGTNMVPLDCMTGKPDYAETKRILTAARDANINFLRIWGGGHIENEDYYSICDELGLMIMQEFTMSSSGCDDVPSKNHEFLDLLKKAAVHNMKVKRNHASLIFWDGGNELSDEKYIDRPDHEGHPATFEDSTLAMLFGLAHQLSPDVAMLPSSGSGPNALLKPEDKGNNHDVHGPWGYLGVEEHYKFYNESDSIVHGEFGCGGMSGYEQITKIVSKEHLKVTTSLENSVWAHHSGGWDNYAFREQAMFGDLRSMPIEDYIKVSQYVQFESLRYSLESNRRRQWKNVGQMTWQFNEPWPNLQCSNVLEYYGGKKLGYYAVKEAYDSVNVSLKYNRIFYSATDSFEGEMFIINDNKTADYKIDCKAVTDKGQTLFETSFSGVADEGKSQLISEIRFGFDKLDCDSFSLLLDISCGDYHAEKEYLMFIAEVESEMKLSSAEKARMERFFKEKGKKLLTQKRANPTSAIKFFDRQRKKCQNL